MRFRFSMVMALLAAMVMVAIPVQASPQQPSFWAREGVEAAREVGLVPEALECDYNTPITRAEFCSLAATLYRTWDEEGTVTQQTLRDVSFQDCDEEDVLLCASLGVVNGVGGGQFQPDAPIERQEAASILHRLAVLQKDYKDDSQDRMPHVFKDGEEIRSWARDDIYWAYRNGILLGVGENCFDPCGAYTREQSILTMLRLYDSAYAEPPAEEQKEDSWHVVVDNMGVGVSRVHLEDAEGNRMLTDFGETGGTFYQIGTFGQWLSLIGVDQSMAMYAPATENLMVGYQVEQADRETGVGWAAAYYGPDASRYRMVVYDDGTTGGRYCPAGDWLNGRAIVWLDANTLAAIDRDENVLWTFAAPADWDTLLCDGAGDRAILDQNGKKSLLADGKLTALPENSYPILTDWSDSYILGINGFYTLYDQSGKAMAGPYANALGEVGQDIYCRWVSNTRYEYFRCAAGGSPKVLYTVDVSTGRPGKLPTDGSGVYALRTNSHTIVCFDRFGDELGTIHLEFEMDPYASITFENGCVRVTCSDQHNGEAPLTGLYLPTGQQLS